MATKKQKRHRYDTPKHERDPELDADGLTPQEAHAVERFLHHGNKALAEREAGLVSATPGAVFNIKTVKAVLQREVAERMARYRLEPGNILAELSYVTFSRVGDLYRSDGSLKQPHELDMAVSAAISTVEFDKETGELIRYRFHNKGEAIAMAMKFRNLMNGGTVQGADRLKDVLAAFRAGPVKRLKE